KMYTKETDDETIKKMKEKGYSQNDFVGVSGIEATMEEELSGAIGTRQGKRVVEVNQKGKIMRELETSLPTPGNNVVLSIDLPLQKVLETALKNNIQEIRNRQEEAMAKTPSVYAKKVADRGGTPIQMATQGAAIVMDVNTGEILALASYPSFDPNIFTGGISTEDYKALTEDKSYPLFNKAVSSRAAPGSAFKMVTGLAGLMEGKMTVSKTINDESPFTTGMITGLARAPKCWIWPHCEEHQNENIEKALKDSCNYYFFTVAYELGINLLDKWADKFGLTSKTGIELPGEVKGIIGSQKMLYDNTKPVSEQATSIPTLVRRLLIRTLKEYFKEYWKTTAEEAACDVAADELLKLAGTEEEHGPNIRRIINEQLHIPQTTTGYKRWDQKIDSILYELQWNSTRTVVTGVGQGITLVTPIEMVRYVAALVNGGNVLEPHLVKRVVDHEGRPVSEKTTKVVSTLDAPSGYIKPILQGMQDVVSPEDRGTAYKYFTNYKYRYMIGAKTGTAQVSKIDIENTSWFVAFAPFDRPEIAMVVYIPNGYSGGLSSLTAKDVIEYYLDNKLKIANDDTPTVGKLTE
ncbi:MAG: penicillin-binding transpeptidase domain-containing protein, partial [Bacillota bacterium]|nr:penicillin-binding transpeptidase domain-containing protein [Bacillota bacterium]